MKVEIKPQGIDVFLCVAGVLAALVLSMMPLVKITENFDVGFNKAAGFGWREVFLLLVAIAGVMSLSRYKRIVLAEAEIEVMNFWVPLIVRKYAWKDVVGYDFKCGGVRWGKSRVEKITIFFSDARRIRLTSNLSGFEILKNEISKRSKLLNV